MSFILDALKKSENERQEQGSAEFANVPTSTDEPRGTQWLWLLGLLLLINLAVLMGILMRPDAQPARPSGNETVAAQPPLESAATARDVAPNANPDASFAERVTAARETNRQEAAAAPEAVAPSVAVAPASAPRIKTIDELRLDGSLQLPNLHIDIHVFSDVPSERFVFINMVKYREQSQLAEGPVVNEITTDGVILAYQGRNFLLPRE